MYILIRKAVAHLVHTPVDLPALGETSSADEEVGARPRQTHVLLRRKCMSGGGIGHVLRPGTPKWDWHLEVGLAFVVGLMFGSGTGTLRVDQRMENRKQNVCAILSTI